MGRRGDTEKGWAPADEVDALTGDPNFMASLGRGLAVIRAFSQEEKALTIAQVSQRTGIPRAAVRRCLYTLGKLGYVAANERHFSLRPKILTLGHAYLTSTPLASAAQPFLDQVTAAVHESCSLAVLDEQEIVYLARSKAATRIMSIDLRPGSRLPAYCTSLGRVLLAHLPPAEQRASLARLRPVKHTERTVTSREKLSQVLEAVRRSGHAIVDQELEIGLRSMAVPVRDAAGQVVAAMNVGTQAARVPIREMTSRILPELQAAAAELGMILLP
jgi:IclR family pca regulon transcriptional regulator